MTAHHVRIGQYGQKPRTDKTLAVQGPGRYGRISAHALRATPRARTAKKQHTTGARMLPPVRLVRSVRTQAQQACDLYVGAYATREYLYVRARAPFSYLLF